MKTRLIRLLMLVAVLAALAGCSSHADDDDHAATVDDDAVDDDSSGSHDDDTINPGDDDDLNHLVEIFENMGVDRYIGIKYVHTTPGPNGYTYYYYNTADCRCTFGDQMVVAVHPGSENKVMLFMEGGFAVPLDFPWDIGFKSFDEDNPLRNWSYVYIPHCDHSVHSGDNELVYDGAMHYHHGLRQVSAAVTLMKELFPHPEKILVSGSSAGGYGTFMAWAVVKSQYMNTKTYVMNDSGTGFWSPAAPEFWNMIKQAWNLRIPAECTKCDGTILTYLYELYMKYDPQVRIGMFSSYQDWIISTWFLGMTQDNFERILLSVTNEIYDDYPDRFHRFFIKGATHTTYEFLLPGGPHRAIRGTSLYEWIGQLVNDDPAWDDLLE